MLLSRRTVYNNSRQQLFCTSSFRVLPKVLSARLQSNICEIYFNVSDGEKKPGEKENTQLYNFSFSSYGTTLFVISRENITLDTYYTARTIESRIR